jgi:hypothetical protein
MILRRKDANHIAGLLFALVLLAALLVLSDRAQAAVFCVDTPSALQSALDVAVTNSEDDTIQVVQGTYLTPGSQFEYSSQENFSIILLGGFTSGCESRVLDPTNTILDGQNVNRVIRINPGTGSGNIVFQGFTVRNGNASVGWDGGGGLNFGGLADSSGDYTIDHNIFIGNTTSRFGGGLCGGSDLGITHIHNNLILNNNAKIIHGAASLTSNGTAYITNNTVCGNSSKDPGGGLRLAASNIGSISNNIFFGNSAVDLILDSPGIVLLNNDIGTLEGTPGAGSTENLNVDPLFVAPEDFHLRGDSPLIDKGAVSPPGGLSTTDIEGNLRVMGSAPDIGAYEFLFRVYPKEGTIGTEITISGSGYGKKKGKVLIGEVPLKVQKWRDYSIRGILLKILTPDSYDVTIQPKEAAPSVIEKGFSVKAPVIDSVDPAVGSAGDKMTITGLFFGSREGKVTLGGKTRRVLTWTMDPKTGASKVRVVVPRGLSPGTHELTITNEVGSGTTNFTCD